MKKPIIFTVNQNDCWICINHRGNRGYPVMQINKTHYMVHRLFYEKFIGPIPPNMVICHKCDTPECINPDHLFLGTQADNVHDMVAKGRNRYVIPKIPPPGVSLKGETNPRSKLTMSQVVNIRNDTRKLKEIAVVYGVSFQTISKIKKGLLWKHVI